MTDKLRFSPALKQQTDACVLKTDWASAVQSGLGNTRRVRCYHDANGGIDPVATGIEFLNVGSSGALTIVNGNIVGLGTLSSLTKRIATDISTGTSTLRIEGNGQWTDGSLGLPNAATLFHLTENITNDSGMAFNRDAEIKAPAFLDSGTGPLSPVPTAGMVTKYRLCDWSSGSRVVVGTRAFTIREPNLVMQQPWMAHEMGDVRRYRTSEDDPLAWGTGGDSYLVGGDVLIANSIINETTGLPLVQAQVRMMPNIALRWANYPFKGQFNSATDTTVPPAHKIEWLDANDNIVDVTEMYSTRDANNTPGSGWPVNDQRLAQNFNTGPVQCSWNCTQTHDYWSDRPKMHSLAQHLCPPVDARSLSPKNVTSFDAAPQNWPVISDGINADGMGTVRTAPKWSRQNNTGFDTTIIDTNFVQSHDNYWITQAIGYGWEPGATGQQTQYMAPGGSRPDRAGWSSQTIRWVSDPHGTRIHGAVPNREIMHHFLMNFFNRGYHYFSNVHTGASLDKAGVKAGNYCYNGDYYAGADQNHRPDIGNTAIQLMVYGRDDAHSNEAALKRDKNGKLFANEFAPDILHNQYTAAIGAYLTVSPRHVQDARHSFNCAMTAAYDFSQGFAPTEFLTRGHNWYLWQLVNMWIVANEDPDGFTMSDIEEMTARHLQQVHAGVMPEYLAQNTIFGVTLKRYGHGWLQYPISIDPLTGNAPTPDRAFMIQPASDFNSKSFYFAQTMLLAKQSGFFARMHAYSPQCAETLDLILNCLSTWAIGVFVDANGRADKTGGFVESYNLNPAYYFAGGISNLPANWGVLCPARGMDWIRDIDGTISSYPDGTNTQHFRAQWLWVMRDFFPEYTFPRLTQAITVADGFYDQIEANFANGGWYWHYRFEMMGKFLPPDYVGAPT